MPYGFLEIAATPSVRAVQARMGAGEIWQDFKGHREFDRFGENEAAFVGDRDSFYIASMSETGWPYVQHRGGPPGFLKVIDSHTIGFADFRGNRQYVSVGNLANNDRVALILVDYPNRSRLKLLGHAQVIAPEQTNLLAALQTPGYRGKVERGLLIRIEAFDWNCPQHITPRYTQAEWSAAAG